MPIEGCPDFATKAELQELRSQLNEALGAKPEGGTEEIFRAGAPLAGGILQSAATIYGATKIKALSALQGLTLSSSGTAAFRTQLQTGAAQIQAIRGSGVPESIPALAQFTKTTGTAATGATVAAGAASTAAAAMSVLMSLVSIAATLGLNIATTKVLGGRIDAEIAGVNIQLDALNAGMIRLYEKNQGDIDAANTEIAQNESKVEQNRIQIVTNAALIQQAESENTNLSFEIEKANTSIQELQSRNQQLRSELDSAGIDIAEINTAISTHIDDIEVRLTEAASIVTKQQETIIKQAEEIELLKTRVTKTELQIEALSVGFVHLRQDFWDLKDDLTVDPDLADARSKLKSAQLIIAQSKVKNINLGGGAGSAAAGTAKAQKGILSLANGLAGNPITVPDISTSDINDRNSPFDQLLAQLLPEIGTGTVTPKQLNELSTNLKSGLSTDLTALLTAAIVPRLDNITDQTTQTKISQGTQKGICSSLNGGGCSTPAGAPPSIQGLGGMNNALGGKVDLLNAALNSGLAGQNTAILNVVTESRSILKNPTFGLQAMQNFASKAWEATHADKVLNIISTTLAVHNGMMLSNNLASTIGEALNVGLQALGIDDSKGNPIDVNTLVRGKVTSMLTNLLGAEQYTALTARIAKTNRIYQAGINVLDTTKNLFDSAHSIAEIGVEHTGQIGNALRDSGVVAENAYDEMIERVNPQNAALRKVQKFRDGIDNIENVVGSVAQVSSEVVEIKENFEQLKTEKKAFADEITVDKEKRVTEREAVKVESKVGTDIEQTDFDRAEPIS